MAAQWAGGSIPPLCFAEELSVSDLQVNLCEWRKFRDKVDVSEKHREKQQTVARQRKIEQTAKKAKKKEAKIAAEAAAEEEAATTAAGAAAGGAATGSGGLGQPVRVSPDGFEDVASMPSPMDLGFPLGALSNGTTSALTPAVSIIPAPGGGGVRAGGPDDDGVLDDDVFG